SPQSHLHLPPRGRETLATNCLLAIRIVNQRLGNVRKSQSRPNAAKPQLVILPSAQDGRVRACAQNGLAAKHHGRVKERTGPYELYDLLMFEGDAPLPQGN